MSELIILDDLSWCHLIGQDTVATVWFILPDAVRIDDVQVDEAIKTGCRLIMVSGEGSEAVHDHIDDVLLDSGLTDPPVTTWYGSEELEEAINDFETLSFSDDRVGLRLIVAPDLRDQVSAVLQSLC